MRASACHHRHDGGLEGCGLSDEGFAGKSGAIAEIFHRIGHTHNLLTAAGALLRNLHFALQEAVECVGHISLAVEDFVFLKRAHVNVLFELFLLTDRQSSEKFAHTTENFLEFYLSFAHFYLKKYVL